MKNEIISFLEQKHDENQKRINDLEKAYDFMPHWAKDTQMELRAECRKIREFQKFIEGMES